MRSISGAELLALIHHYGYIGLTAILILGIVGLPLPDETILTAVGYFVYKGSLSYFPALFFGILGASLGITLSYALGVFIGRPLLLRYGRYLHITEKSLDRVERYFKKYGAVTLFAGFFVPGVRHVTAIVAGLGGMSYGRFAFPAYMGVCVWVTVFITLGRFAGPKIAGFTGMLSVTEAAWILAGLTIASFLALVAVKSLGNRQ
ncbi:DedA family protein [Sulfoacidibacillus thermotolerans]|uniref:VTT domain-containing protein n=1 Tax=Sulfoacidibacillus thermotolerans TaxID=1765684 RepID=A0A2U3DCE2_SULT2|nr:DedA family protein [Sulfoacidibacillus thermotolerans]PWI58938.1 hypothetical protein BM613_02365 [Sulfoacidibacillus thermotolerans]